MENLQCIYRRMTSFGSGLLRPFFYFVLGVSVFSPLANATDYYWIRQNVPDTHYSSAAQACPPTSGWYQANDSKFDHVNFITENVAYCMVMVSTANNGVYNMGPMQDTQVIRQGDSCPTGTTYDATTGECKGADNKCSILAGTVVPSFRWQSSTDTPGSTVSKNGCEVSVTGPIICLNRTSGYYDCTGTGTVTGNELEAATSASDCSGSTCTDGQPQKEVSSTGCTMIASGSGSTCTTSEKEDNPGTTKCGTVNGAWTCIESPKSTSSTSTSNISKTTTADADGGTTTTTKTDTTTTTCKGVGSCTTSTTTTTTTGGTTASGTSKGESTTCTGSACGGSGSSDSGSGTSDSGDDEEDDQDEESSVAGDMVCDSTPSCTGDAIQCAILRQTQQSRCQEKTFFDTTDATLAGVKTNLDTQFAGADYQPITADSDHTFDLNSMLNTSSTLGASCPVFPTISTTWVDGRAVSVDLNVEGLCTFLTYMGYLLVAFAMRRAAEIIGQGV